MCDSPFSVGCAHVGLPLRNMYDVPISLLEEPSKCAANYKIITTSKTGGLLRPYKGLTPVVAL